MYSFSNRDRACFSVPPLENSPAPPSSRTCARTSSSAIPRPPCIPVTTESSSRRSSAALPRHGSADSSDSADRDSVLGGTRRPAQISRRK